MQPRNVTGLQSRAALQQQSTQHEPAADAAAPTTPDALEDPCMPYLGLQQREHAAQVCG